MKTRITVRYDQEAEGVIFIVEDCQDDGSDPQQLAVTQAPDAAALLCMARPLFMSAANLAEHSREVESLFEAIDVSGGDVLSVVSNLIASGGLDKLKDSILRLTQDVSAVINVFSIIGKSAHDLRIAADRKCRASRSGLSVVQGGRIKT